MAKSHYFVAPSQDDDGLVECAECGLPFKPVGRRWKYCSRECYQLATKKVKARWFQRNKGRLREKRRVERRENGIRPFTEYLRHQKSRRGRNRVIKQELILLELQTRQIREVRREMDRLKWGGARRGYSQEKVDLVKSELASMGLYPEQIESSDRYSIDWDSEYKGGWI